MKYLLLVLFCVACTILVLAQPRPDRSVASASPSPALLDAMSSHGIEVGSAAETAADAPAPADANADAATPQLQPALLSDQAPVMQPAVYRRNGR